MESIIISNNEELLAEIARLRVQESEQKIELAARFNGPKAIFASVKSLFPKTEGTGPDFLKIAARFAIPFTLNKTVFRNSNFLVKTLVSLVSQKAAGAVTEGSIEGVFAKGKSLFGKLFQKKDADSLYKTAKLSQFNNSISPKVHE